MDETGSGSNPVIGFNTDGVEPSSAATTVLIKSPPLPLAP
jgi:hypothetical protein